MALVPIGIVLALRDGVLPVAISPLPALDLGERDPWLLDWRLAEVRRDTDLCRRIIRSPHLTATPVPPSPLKDGCGWTNGVRIAAAGRARLAVDAVSCEMAAALAMWIAHEVQPAAREILGTEVAGIEHLGAFSCRNIVGTPYLSRVRSQHASANALDIAVFMLADRRRVSVLTHWSGHGPEARFLHRIHRAACRYFRVAIGPDFNAAHRNHFHLDRGLFSACR